MASQLLPLPVARLARRSRNAKSPKDLHDTAYFALEVSVRLAVAALPPEDPTALARGSLGHWVAAARVPERSLQEPELLELFELLTEVGLEKAARKRSVGSRQLLAALPAYRNRVVGHGSVRATEFYARAGGILLAGLEAAWRAGVFLPLESSLRFVESTSHEDDARRASVLDLTGESPRRLDALGTPVPAQVAARMLYLVGGAHWHSLFPWALFDDESQRLFCFNGLARRAEYLDYASGETLAGDALDARAPGAIEALHALFPAEALADLRRAAREGEGDPNRFGDYRILGKLGEGGMGVVYLARQESLERLVALKMLPPAAAADPVAVARFQREVRALSRCEHPNVVKILAYGETRGTHYYAMEYVQGADLGRVVRASDARGDFHSAVSSACSSVRAEREERFPDLPEVESMPPEQVQGAERERQIARFFRDAARGLEHLHERGIVHRDVSPANVMVTWPEQRAVIMDLGLAAVEDASLSLTREGGQVLGTLRYMAPEQLRESRAAVDARADVYSLGAGLFELLCGRPVFDGDTQARLMQQLLHEDAPAARKLRPDLPEDLATIVGKAVEREPRMRYASAAELADDLDAFLSGRPISARPPTLGYVLSLAVRRHRLVASLVAVVLLAVIGGLGGIGYVQAKSNTDLDLQSDIYELPFAVAQAADLWPCVPSKAPLMEAWLSRAELLGARLDLHRARLADFELEDHPDLANQRELVAALERLIDPETGTLADVRRRLEVASSIERRSLVDAVEAWQEAIGSISNRDECPDYDGLVIPPQLGLVPIGRDGYSGLWEFAHLLSGDPPRRDEQGELVLTPEVGIVLVLLPGGRFLMGSDRVGIGGRNRDPQSVVIDEAPIREVALDPFFVSKYEMTQAQWTRATGRNPSLHTAQTSRAESRQCTSLCPIEEVSWNLCFEVTRNLALSLPTEAQWEFAARAGTHSIWFVGDRKEDLQECANLADELAKLDNSTWDCETWSDGWRQHAPVGKYFQNPFGLHDTAGNVWEWCLDSGPDALHNTARPGDGLFFLDVDPTKSMHQCRGGSWAVNASLARSATRYPNRANFQRHDHGLRPSRVLEHADAPR